MGTKRVAIAELEGVALDWAVASSTGKEVEVKEVYKRGLHVRSLSSMLLFQPSTEWEHGGPLIERYFINIHYWSGLGAEDPPRFRAEFAMHIAGKGRADGETILIAACRAIVAAHNQDGFVEVPDELVEGE